MEGYNLNYDLSKTVLEDVNYAKKEFENLYNQYGDNPKLFNIYKQQILLIEQLEREYNHQSGFAKYQELSHDYVLALPTFKPQDIGKFDIDFIEPFYNIIQEVARCISKTANSYFNLKISGLAPASAGLLIDITPEYNEKDNPKKDYIAKTNEIIKKTKELTNKVIKSGGNLIKSGDPEIRVDNFLKETELINPERALTIFSNFEKLYPKNKNIEIIINDKEQNKIILEPNNKEFLIKAKSNLEESINKKNEEDIITGYLGAMYKWEEDKPKFMIKTEDKKRITITYEVKEEATIKENYGKKVTLRRHKDGNEWYFLEWLIDDKL